MIIALFLAACVVPHPADTGEPPGTSETADTASSVTIRDWVWEEDRQCWGLRETERPAAYWESWFAEGCEMMGEYADVPYADADGNCTKWAGGLEGDCAVADPWIQSCETSALAECCEHPMLNGPSCMPYEYEP